MADEVSVQHPSHIIISILFGHDQQFTPQIRPQYLGSGRLAKSLADCQGRTDRPQDPPRGLGPVRPSGITLFFVLIFVRAQSEQCSLRRGSDDAAPQTQKAHIHGI